MKTVALGDVTSFVRGVTFKPTDVVSDGVGIMRTKNVQKLLELDDVMRISRSLVKRADQFLREGDTLVSSANSWAAVGKGCWVPKLPEPLVIGGFVTALRPSSPLIDPRYLYLWFTSPNTQATLRSFSNKTTNISNLNLRLAAQMHLALPPLEEQRRIVAILDQADAIRAKRREALVHLDSLAQAIFRDMFGDLSHTQPLSELVTQFRYGTSSKSGPQGHPTLRIPNIVGGGISHAEIKTVSVRDSELSRLALRENDILFVRTNGNPDNVGRSAVFTQSAVADAGYGESPWIFASYLIRARLHDGAAAAFITTFLTTPLGRKHLRDRSKTSAGQYNINIDGIGSVPVPVSDHARHVEFSARIEQLDSRRACVRDALATDDELFVSLQSRAFRGEL